VADHVAPILTVAQARALVAAAELAEATIQGQRDRFAPSTWTRRLAQTQRALVGARAALARVLPDSDPAVPGPLSLEGTP
jgi:hypothetical protein